MSAVRQGRRDACDTERQAGCLRYGGTSERLLVLTNIPYVPYFASTIPAKPSSSEMLKSAGYFFSGSIIP